MNLRDALTDDLRREQYRGNKNPLAGHCYVASEALYHRLLSFGIKAKPMFIRHEGRPHWFLKVEDIVIDYTAEQFTTAVPYNDAKGKGFLTKEPSKRAELVMLRLGWL